MQSCKKPFSLFFEISFLFLLVSLMLGLGSDPQGHVVFRKWLSLGVLVLAIPLFQKKDFAEIFKSPSLLAFLLFFGYEVVRALWALFQMKFHGATDTLQYPLTRFTQSPLVWSYYFLLFTLAFLWCRGRQKTFHLLVLLFAGGIFLAMNAIPSRLIYRLGGSNLGYSGLGYENVFFFPILYIHRGVADFFLATWYKSNIPGDLMAVGFFSGAAGLLYLVLSKDVRSSWKPVTLIFLGILVAAGGVLSLLSRGTILAFLGALGIFTAFSFFKMKLKGYGRFLIFFFVALIFFMAFLGKGKRIFRELQTISVEVDAFKRNVSEDLHKSKSVYAYREGAARALAMFRDHPVWGVGTYGYQHFSKLYSTGEEGLRYKVTNFYALSHYLHLLAEEGVGAYFYFFFLLLYFGEMLYRLTRIKSRFQFLAGLALFCGALLILVHAAVYLHMQHFSIALFVAILMGASLGVLKDSSEKT